MCLVNALDATELYKEEICLGKRIDSFDMNVGDAVVSNADSVPGLKKLAAQD